MSQVIEGRTYRVGNDGEEFGMPGRGAGTSSGAVAGAGDVWARNPCVFQEACSREAWRMVWRGWEDLRELPQVFSAWEQ